MNNPNKSTRPRMLLLSLQSPAALFVSDKQLDIDDDVEIDGVAVEANDTPWTATVADLIIDKDTRSFIGVTFQVNCQSNWQPVRSLCERLDPSVARYNEIAAPEDELIYPGEAGTSHRFEITWARAHTPAIEWAQLLCGQWYWLYATEGDWGISKPVSALQLDHIEEILDEHELSFPKTELQQLNVRFPNRE